MQAGGPLSDGELRRRALWCVVALSLLVVPNVAAVVTPFERWPFTCGPMFAANPGAAVRYTSAFLLEHKDGRTTPLRTRKTTGYSEWQFRRVFLVAGWGADDDGSFIAYDDDDDDARAARVAAFFDAVIAAARAKPKMAADFADVVAVRVEVVADGDDRVRVLGRYVVDAHRFDIDPAWRR